ncbi:hypothetical protein Ae717Ps2_1945 [Pseudonocardia sp. Ae717_Ps2]|nr:hypothetical protein Ae717Ps2_1945 [Pseudonocardia sp. Ae717_Ps2]
MHPPHVVDRARSLYRGGMPVRSVAAAVGVPERTVRHWCTGTRRTGDPRRTRARCFRCAPGIDVPVADYAYLLGMYLGDGHLTAAQRTHCLWIYCGDDWPGIIDDVRAATAAVLPGASVSTTPRAGSTAVKCFSRHWTCLFPQHGPGMKHTRPIRLEPWQRAVVDTRPDRFLRGLFHSDGCRTTNRVRAVLADGSVREYSYPRWFFDNTSEDIMRLAEGALDLLGIAHRRARRTCLSVARADAVAELDAAIGPKT